MTAQRRRRQRVAEAAVVEQVQRGLHVGGIVVAVTLAPLLSQREGTRVETGGQFQSAMPGAWAELGLELVPDGRTCSVCELVIDRLVGHDHAVPAHPGEIGRASCRERVCQYV